MKVLYLTYENVFKTGILQAQVLEPLTHIASRYKIEFLISSVLRNGDSDDEVYIANKSNFHDKQLSNVHVFECRKNLERGSNAGVFFRDILRLLKMTSRMASNSDIIHCRSYSAAIVGCFLSLIHRKKFIFDMRGVQPEELVYEGRFSKYSVKYKILKMIEKVLIRIADYTFVVSEPFKEYVHSINSSAKVYNISNPTFFSKYTVPSRHKDMGRLRFLFSGSLQPWHAVDETYRLFSKLYQEFGNKIHLVVAANDLIGHKKVLAKYNIPLEAYTVDRVPFEAMPKLITSCQFGFCLTRKSFVTKVCCPVKFAEYIASELVIITNEGIGDLSMTVRNKSAGVVFEDTIPTSEEYTALSEMVGSYLNGSVNYYSRDVFF
jgi:hypothetical protein